MLYASAVRSVSNQVTAMDSHTGGALHAYKSRVATNVQLLYQELVTAEIQNITIGIVVPGRMVNALAMLQSSTKKLRFFDDNPALHGTYYPPIAIPIEPTSSLISQPTDIVFVMTQTFGEQLANRLRASMGSHARILTMTELYEGSLAAAH